MPKKRKATAAMNIPPSYLYPPYGYVPTPSYNIENRSPAQSDYIYYPLDEHGRVMGPPTILPPIGPNPHQQVFHPYSHNPPVYSSYLHSPRREPIFYNDYYHQYPYSDRSYEKPRHENLPPLYRIVFIIILFFLQY